MRKRAFRRFVVFVCFAALGGAAVAATSRLLKAPFGLHAWMPLPVACADLRCVTYRELASKARQADSLSPAELLTRLLTQKVRHTVARRSGLTVSEDEVRSAIQTIPASTNGTALRAYLTENYGSEESAVFRAGMRDLLQQQKLQAAGIKDIWSNVTTPAVRILNIRIRWDSGSHRVLER